MQPTDSISAVARLGLVHHMLYPATVDDPDLHERTLTEFVRRSDIETFDCCFPYGQADRRQRLAAAARASDKQETAFAIHLFPLRKLLLSAPNYAEQAQVRLILKEMIADAAAMGATGFVFGSGGPPSAEASPAHHRAFLDFCRWLCAELAPHGIDALLEPFDYDFDKKFIYGPLDANLKLVAKVREEFPNIGIELDMAHLPLMREGFESAIERSAPWLKRVHLGNCVMRNPADPFYGDNHPPMGYPGGEIDEPELVRILRTLHKVGFLNAKQRGNLLLELKPFPGRTEEESVTDNWQRLGRAWDRVRAEIPA